MNRYECFAAADAAFDEMLSAYRNANNAFDELAELHSGASARAKAWKQLAKRYRNYLIGLGPVIRPWLDPVGSGAAQNFVTSTGTLDGRKFSLTFQFEDGETPQERIDSLRATINSLKQELAAEHSTVGRLQQNNDDLHMQVACTKAERDSARRIRDTLENELEQERLKRIALENNASLLRQERDKATERYNNFVVQLNNLYK